MSCYRATVTLLLALFTACATCSCLFPLFRVWGSDTGDVVQRYTYYYWYMEVAWRSSGGVWTTQREYTRDLACVRMRDFYVAASALAVSAAGLGGLATLLSAVSVYAGRSLCLGVSVFVLTALGCACAVTVVGLMAYAYRSDFCGGSYYSSRAPNAVGYSAVEGFALVCVAAGGLLSAAVTLAIGLCCGCFGARRRDARAAEAEEQRAVAREPVDRRAPQDSTATVSVADSVNTQVQPVKAADAHHHDGHRSGSEPGLYPYQQKA